MVNDTEVKVTANGMNILTIPAFAFPKFAMPGGFGEIAQQGLARAQEGCDKLKSVSEAAAEALRETYSNNASYGLKVIEISSANTASAFDFFAGLLGSKSMTDVVALSATQACKTFETTSAQNKELWELAQRFAVQGEPIRKHVANVLKQAG